MTLSKLINPELVLVKAACTSKDELISKLVDLIYKADRNFPFPKKDVLNSIFLREQIGGTLLPSGLSVPHSRLRDFEGFIFAMGAPAEPLLHEGIRLRLMALMITNQPGGSYYLPVVAALTKLTRDESYLSHLCAAENAMDFISLLRERDSELA